MTPAEWNAVLHKDTHWKDCYPIVEREARLVLNALADGETLSTMELCGRLYPAIEMRGQAAIDAHRRLVKAILILAEHGLAGAATKGNAVKRMGRVVRPWRWCRPAAIECCALCGQEIRSKP